MNIFSKTNAKIVGKSNNTSNYNFSHNDHQYTGAAQQQRAGQVQNQPGTGLIPAAAGDGEQRCAAAAEQIAKRRNNDNNGKAKPHRAQRRRADIRDARNINAVHNVIQQVQHLRHQHGQRCFQDVLCNAAVFKVDLPHGEWFILSVFTIPVSSIA